jgi:hypothetical protein
MKMYKYAVTYVTKLGCLAPKAKYISYRIYKEFCINTDTDKKNLEMVLNSEAKQSILFINPDMSLDSEFQHS